MSQVEETKTETGGSKGAAAAGDANNPETTNFIYHGMGMVQNKTTVQNLESRKATW